MPIILNGSHDYAGVLRNVSNAVYMGEASKLFSNTTSASMSCGAATYNGLSVNIAFLFGSITHSASYVAPTVDRFL